MTRGEGCVDGGGGVMGEANEMDDAMKENKGKRTGSEYICHPQNIPRWSCCNSTSGREISA